MADDSDEKTEEPTGKKLKDSRDQGQIGRSMDLTSAAILLAGLAALSVYGGDFVTANMDLMREYFTGYRDWYPNPVNITSLANHLLQQMFAMLWPILLILVLVGMSINILQVGLNFTLKPLEPKLSKVFSMGAITRMFGKMAWIELLKGLAKVILVGFVSYWVIRKHFEDILYMADMELMVFINYLIDVILELLIKVILLLLVLGVADLFYQKRKTHNDLKMTKQEVKDEHKNSQGDPKVLAARRRAMLKMHQQFMMKEVPSATVVITNPTHLAIAFRYERGKDNVPVVVAKGKDKVAERIKAIAQEHEVPMVENKPLARAMFDVVEVGEPIPAEFFGALAEVLAYVFNSKAQKLGVA